MIFLVQYKVLRDFLEEIAPPHLESDWDNSGVQVRPEQETIQKILIGLDPTQALVDDGITGEMDLILTHHPLIFSQLDNLNEKTPTGKKLFRLTRNEIGLFSIHTSFDQSKRGLSQGLAEKLELGHSRPLTQLKAGKLFKLEVFVPKDEENSVIEALTEAGAGKIGNYENSYYRWKAEGNFKPINSAEPYQGQAGQSRTTKEIRLDFLVNPDVKGRVLSALKESHPYEEPGFSLEETERFESGAGLGRIGKWDSGRKIEETITFLTEKLEVARKEMTITGNLTDPATRVAASPGSGGAAVNPALNADVDLLITGELDYHERLEALEQDLTVLEVGHYHSEKVFSPWLKSLLRNKFDTDELQIELHEEGIKN